MTDILVSKVRFGQHRVSDRVLGYASARPALSWEISSAPKGWKQTTVQIEVSQDAEPAERYTVYTSNQICVPWPSKPLQSREARAVRIRVAGTDGAWSPWSQRSCVETGLLHNEDWQGSPVTTDRTIGRENPAPIMSRTFTVGQECNLARLDITAGGIFVPYIDGQRVGSDQLAPGWTDYKQRFNALTYDVTELLSAGEHELAVVLGNGWYRGQLTWNCRTNVYGSQLWLLANVRWQDQNGSHSIATNEDWTWRPSSILENDSYDGQTQDMRIPLLNPHGKRGGVIPLPMPSARIRPQEAPTAQVIRQLPGQKLIITPSGKRIVDFGQNLSGWVRMHIHAGHAGQEVVLKHAEVLEHGELGTRPLRKAKATDRFILSDQEEYIEPMFTQHGFRYVQVDGIDDFSVDDLQACLVSAAMEPLASFISSEADLNRLFHNARWSTMDNFLTVPTDCPQRDERLGWTGDIAMFAPTALSLFDAGSFLSSWLVDMSNSQSSDGGIPVVVPDVLDGPKLTCGWGDAAVLVPMAVYQATGDTEVLRRFLPMMDKFIDGVDAQCGHSHLWRGGFQFGDWLDPDAPADNPGGSKADPDVVATAYFAHSARLVASAHAVLNQKTHAHRYAQLADEIAVAFRQEYVTDMGNILSDCESVYAMALVWGLLETPQQKKGAAERLADIVRVSGFRIATGFLGTPLVCEALTLSGYSHLAIRLLLQKRCPSWLYPVSMGATTIWERWDSMLPDGSINPGEMTSFNHYALGAIVHWILDGLAGLHMKEPAWRKVRISPVIDAALPHIAVKQKTPYGQIALDWTLGDDSFDLNLDLPVGIEAEIALPGEEDRIYTHGHHSWKLPRSKVCKPQGSIQSIRDLIDSQEHLEALEQALLSSRSPLYQGNQADVTFTKAAKPWLDADLAALPDVASQQGYVPKADDIVESVKGFLSAQSSSKENQHQ
ncbi:alpha-L-rhamnosidase [Bombiscardovia coagulans]|uniref:alpha-L-rhamnosidase n=1 Tax=Bombiscardovia coagulans TaxID=686666 RepID=A0A261EQU9_9BIFI|nr:alpha-L-rhamnosidase [Bombiscardovia coagulans]OZG49229.1 Alpha-L-rhamnosidase [Bombiscardovia coagulans]